MTQHTSERRSIPTRYKNIRFRSKLEADYARAFDALGIEWQYEKEGRYFGDVFYLPDFWLPRSRQFVEVKGVFEPSDCRKIHALIYHTAERPHAGVEASVPDIPIIAAMPDGHFFGWERHAQPRDISDMPRWFAFLTRDCTPVTLKACIKCHGWWFCDDAMGWACQCCGAYDGDHFVAASIDSPLPGFPDLSSLRRHSTVHTVGDSSCTSPSF